MAQLKDFGLDNRDDFADRGRGSGDDATGGGENIDGFGEGSGNGNRGGNSPIEVDNNVNITVVSSISNAALYINNLDSGYKTTSTLTFNSKEFLTPKIFTVKLSEYTSATKFKIQTIKTSKQKIVAADAEYATDFGIMMYPITVSQLIDGKWVDINTVSSSPTSTNVRLEFDLSKNIQIEDPIEDVYQIAIEGDVSSNNIIKYTTSDGVSSFVENDTPNEFIVSTTTSAGLPWIQFEKNGISKYTHNVTYKILNPNSLTPIEITDDFKKEITPGVTRIIVTANKLIIDDENTTLPTIITESDSYEYNIASGDVLQIPYTTTNADSISYSVGTVQRSTGNNGVIKLNSGDFSNGIGQYRIYLQPISTRNGSGTIKQVIINVVSKVYLPGPDITHINYPYNIKGADFKGYREEFQISWQSINTNYIKIFISKAVDEYLLARSAPQGAAKFIVEDVLKQAKVTFNESTDVISFDLILVPYNQEGDTVKEGKHEKITIIFDKGDLKLKRAQVLTDLKMAFESELNTSILEPESSKYLTHYAHFGDGDNKLISTWGIDKDTFSEFEVDEETNIRRTKKEVKTLVLKLYEPLDAKFQTNQQLWVSKIQSIPVINQTVITDETVEECTLLQPNFNLDVGDDIGYQILDDLIASGSVSSTELIEQYLGTNEFSLNKLDLNYISGSEYTWPEFVKYSSAAERVENFFYKAQTIEFHTNTLLSLESSSLATTGSISVLNEITRIEDKIFNIKKGFDSFEQLLFTQPGELTYPGAGGTALSGSTSSATQAWYTSIIDSATEYDKYNKNALVNNIPNHISTDAKSQDFVLFFNMIGQHFDVIWSYIKGVAKSKQLTHNYDDGMTNDLIYHMLESLGWDADMGVKSQMLWEYAFGKNKDGTSASSISGKERQQEIWRRLLNNLPYLYKHKGTKRALTAAMACYGIPSSMLTIMEFGGPVDPSTDGVSTFTFDDRTAAIKFDDVASVIVPWHEYTTTSDYPNSVEMRINTELRRNHTLISGSGWDLKLNTETLSGSMGYLEMTMGAVSASTSWFPVFNDEYTQIVINRTVSGSLDIFDIYGKEGFNERIRNQAIGQLIVSSSSSTWESGTTLTLGEGLYGTMDEFRLWSTPLDESRINNHTLLPDAIDGNHVSASTEELIFRLDFEYPKDRSSGGDTAIKNVSINQLYGESYATASNFTSVTEYPYQYIPYERSVTANVPSTGVGFSNKVRFESHTLENYLNFGTTSNVTSFENADDSSKLGLFFSPIREINLDILRSLGQFNIDNYIGNPSDMYNDGYGELNTLRKYYFQRFNLNIYEYIQLVRYIDQTLFTTLESLVPGRAKVSTGLLIEPHLLERSKVKHVKPIAEELSHETNISVDSYNSQIGSYETKEAQLDATDSILLDSAPSFYNGEIDTETDLLLESNTSFYNGDIEANELTTLDAENILYNMDINADFGSAIVGEYDASQFQQVGMDVDSVDVNGFGIVGSNGHTIRTRIDKDGNRVQERLQVYRIQESSVINIPENVNYSDSSLGTTLVPKTVYKYKVTTIPFPSGSTPASPPSVGGNITEVVALDGYFPSHYRYTGDSPTGLERSYSIGSKQTALTTLDSGPAWETFITNPNVLKVNDSGRGSGEPILNVN